MKQRIITGSLLFLLIVCGGGAVYYKQQAADYQRRWAAATKRPSQTIEVTGQIDSIKPAPLPETGSTNEWTREIDALLLELEQKEREIAELQSMTNRTVRARNLFSAEARKARMEELKQNDPEAYAEMTARREERRNRVQTAFAQRAITLLDRIPSDLTPEETEEHEHMLQTLDETWRLTELINSPDTPPADRREIRAELSEKSRELRPLLENERDRQLYELGTASGYSEAEAEAFVDYVNETLEATSLPQTGRRRR